MASDKSRTAYGYTETDSGPIEHLEIVGIFGIRETLHAPVVLIPHRRNFKGLPFPETSGCMLVYALPGGSKITQDGKIVG